MHSLLGSETEQEVVVVALEPKAQHQSRFIIGLNLRVRKDLAVMYMESIPFEAATGKVF